MSPFGGPTRYTFYSRWFFRAYAFFPHRLINRVFRGIMTARRPRWLIDRIVSGWIRIGRIRLEDFEEGPFGSLEKFFLRRLREGARPLGPGFVSPVDGLLYASGKIGQNEPSLSVKGESISLGRLVNGRTFALSYDEFRDGVFLSIFLTPSGYHHIHMPIDGEIVDCRWIPGRSFPQNEFALAQTDRTFERNERAVLRCRMTSAHPFVLVLIGAGLVGGIHLEGLPRRQWTQPREVAIGRGVAKGEKVGHFTFGSTIVILLPRALVAAHVSDGSRLRMGQTLFTVPPHD